MPAVKMPLHWAPASCEISVALGSKVRGQGQMFVSRGRRRETEEDLIPLFLQ